MPVSYPDSISEKEKHAEIKLSKGQELMREIVQHYNPSKYWKRRAKVVDPKSKLPKLLKILYLYYIKKCDAFNNASLGTHLGFGAKFASIPNFPHGLYGIIVSHNATVGKNATIYHQVTIGAGKNGAPQIGDNVIVGAGAKVLGGISIGDNVLIGAGAVVTTDVPDNSIVRAAKGTIFEK